jgi:hypothetical protein
MSDTRVIAALDSATLAADHDATERWNRWVERGRLRDARNGRRMGIFATAVAVALAGMLGWVVLSAS